MVKRMDCFDLTHTPVHDIVIVGVLIMTTQEKSNRAYENGAKREKSKFRRKFRKFNILYLYKVKNTSVEDREIMAEAKPGRF